MYVIPLARFPSLADEITPPLLKTKANPAFRHSESADRQSIAMPLSSHPEHV